MKTKKIFCKELAIFLRKNGCKIVGTEVNFKKPQFDVYLFEDTDKLENLMGLWKISK